MSISKLDANQCIQGAFDESSGALKTSLVSASITTNIAGIPGSLGQLTSASSMSVVLASDQPAIPISGTVAIQMESIEIGKVDQGSANTLSNAWPFKLTDGTKSAQFGSQTSASSLAVVIANDQPAIPISGTVSLVSESIEIGKVDQGTPNSNTNGWPVKLTDGIIDARFGSTVTASSLAVVLPSDQAAIPATQSGTWNINNISGTVSLPTGAATSANQTTANSTLSSISGQLPSTLGQKASASSLAVVIANDQSPILVTGPISGTVAVSNLPSSLGQAVSASSVAVTIASDQSAIPSSQSGTWNINNVSGSISLPTGAATSANQSTANTTLSNISGQLPTSLGSHTSASSLAVVVASDQGAIPVSQNGTWNINSISGTISLPAGAATSANQTTANTTLSNISGQIPVSLGQHTSASSMAVVIASDQSAIPSSQSGTWNINNISGTVSLPTGAATAANQTTANSSLSTISGQLPGTLGQHTSASSLAVVIASDQTHFPIELQDGSGNSITSASINGNRGLHEFTLGYSSANAPVYNDYTSTNITTSAYVQLVASTTSATQEIEIFDSSGQALYLATGGSGSEVNQLIIVPGGNGRIKFNIPASTRVSAKAITATANAGFLTINFYG